MTQPGPTATDAAANEQRVLDELEQLQLAIRATREKRVRVQADFDAHLRAFEPPRLERVSPSPLPEAARPALSAASAQAVAPLSRNPQAIPVPAPTQAPVSSSTTPVLAPRGTPSGLVVQEGGHDEGTPTPGHSRRSRVLPVALAAAAVTLVAWSALWVMKRTPAVPPPTEQRSSASPPEAVRPAPLAAARPVPPVDPHPVRIDLTTLRRVWLRVSVDGRIAIEREVAAGEHLPFGADRSIVVRAGDAGAVTVRTGEVDQGPIGRDGQVVTRTFPEPVR